MPDSKITALTALTAADPANDMIPIVDVSDTPPASGNTKRISINNILAASGTATLASATISGALTVGSNAASGGAVRLSNNSLIVFRNAANTANIVALSIDGSNALTLNEGNYTISSNGVSTWSVGGSTAMTLNATGLGIGVAPSAYGTGIKGLDLGAWAAVAQIGGSSFLGFNAYASTTSQFNYKNTGAIACGYQQGTSGHQWLNAPSNAGAAGANATFTTAMTLDASGNLGIGVTPSAWGATAKAIQIGSYSGIYNDVDFTVVVNNAFFNGTNNIYRNTAPASQYYQQAGSHVWRTAPSGTAGNTITYTQAMTLDASGNLLVGTTTSASSRIISSFLSSSGNLGIKLIDSQSNNTAVFANFSNGTGTLGTITNNNNAGVLYNTISDYRLKESVTPLSGGLARVNALKPSIYKWKSSGSSGEGFLAHELAEVVPFAVSGEKDAVNADGSIKSQGIDMSRVVPILVAAIQELTARVQTLETR